MSVVVREEPMSALAAHARVSIAYLVDRVVEVARAGERGFTLTERRLDEPYAKDYDEIAPPAEWPAQFDVARWGLLGAHDGPTRVGGAVVAWDTAGVTMLEARRDLAVLWDLRVAPAARRRGVGTLLFRAAGAWARARGCRELKVETQDTNAAACAFYASRGCVLRAAIPGAYADGRGETQLLWYRDLAPEFDAS